MQSRQAQSPPVPAWSTSVSVRDGCHMARGAECGQEECAPRDRARIVPTAPGVGWGIARLTAVKPGEALGRTISAATRGNSILTLSLSRTFRVRLENRWWKFSCRKWKVFRLTFSFWCHHTDESLMNKTMHFAWHICPLKSVNSIKAYCGILYFPYQCERKIK